jgi:hypothetical protein
MVRCACGCVPASLPTLFEMAALREKRRRELREREEKEQQQYNP